MDAFEKVLYWLIANSLGGLNRGRIINELFSKPQNANELCKNLNVEYKTIRYHLKVLKENLNSRPGSIELWLTIV